MSRYAMAQAGMLLTLVAFSPIPAAAQEAAPAKDIPVEDGRLNRDVSRSRGNPAPAQARTPEQVAAAAAEAFSAAGLACDVTASREIGLMPDGASVIEAACATGLGQIVVTSTPPTVLNCLTVSVQANQALAQNPQATPPRCELPENANAVAGVQPWTQALGIRCTVDDARWIGRTGSNLDRYEIGCSGADGYWIEVAQDGTPASKLECLQIPAGAGTCEFTTPAESAAGIQARLVGSPAADCAATEVRYMGANPNGRFYELKCSTGAGQVVRLADDGGFQQAYDCAQAANIGDGCQLSDGQAAMAAQNERRAGLLAGLGKPCTATDQRLIGQESGGAHREVVEFKCSDAPLGVIALFAAEGAPGSEAIDCLTAKGRSLTCQFTTEDDIKDAQSRMLQAAGRNCAVADYRVIGLMDGRAGQVIEVKCSDGAGFIGEFPATRDRVGDVQTCARAESLGDSCEL